MTESFYKLLLRVYPKDFRLEFETEMLQVFRIQLERAQLEKRVFSFWFCTFKDTFVSAVRERIQKRRKPNMVTINRYDDGARLVFHFTREEAFLLEHNVIQPEHLLLGLLHQNEKIRGILEPLGGNLEYFRNRIRAIQAKGNIQKAPQIASHTRFIMELSAKEARALGSNHVDSRHIMLGLMADQKSLVFTWLQELADPNEIRNQILSV